MYRFFVENDQVFEGEIEITGGDVNHISTVLRLGVEDRIEIICDGQVYETEIIEVSQEYIMAKILDRRKGENEPSLNITLYQGLAKGSRMDYVIQKGTEIGIKNFYAVMTKRSVVRLKGKKKVNNRLNRWQKIADEAGKQAMRDDIPEVRDVLDFKAMISMLKDKDNILVPYEEEDTVRIKEGISNLKGRDIHIIIGPEGGFSKEEVEELKEIGGESISLGNRILRTETAGLITAAILLYEAGDI